jgi:predicted permease
MFDNLYGKDIAGNMDMKLGLYAVGFTFFQLALSWAFVVRIEKDNYERGAMIQALYRSNYVLMGFPIAVNLFGKVFDYFFVVIRHSYALSLYNRLIRE